MPTFQGLASGQARDLLEKHGPNDIRPPKRLVWLRRFFEVLSEPTLLVLVVVLLFYLSMGSKGEALLLGAFVLIVIAVTYVEEARTEAAVAALSAFAAPRALVMRDGQWRRLSGLELVPGDLLNITEGDRVAADSSIVEAHDLKVDESLLTGESQAVWKNPAPESPEPERLLFAGTLVLQGQALARVTATGLKTRVGQISKSLSSIAPDPTPFQKSISSLVRVLAGVAVLACGLVVAVNYARGATLVASLLQGLTLAIATVPEELPVILAVFLAMGARRLSKKGVLASHIPAVETLGAVTLLAVDKTGTLTRNEMQLKVLEPWKDAGEQTLLAAAAEASEMEPFDPMELRIVERAPKREGKLTHDYPLAGRPPRMGHIWDANRLALKGAVEGVLEHCALEPGEREEILNTTRGLAGRGLRVLGVAAGPLSGAPPAEMPGGLKFLGLLGFEDPLREGVKESIAEARRAGLRVVMMTGDSVETARAIAAELELPSPDRTALGGDLERSDKVEDFARTVNVFARMSPEHKHILVQAWSRMGEVVGMTGDGVNDAPALTQAHVGVAMGKRGTDVAREAADLVLMDDSFSSLVEGVRLGRDTTRRILRAALFVLAVHVPIIGLVLACLFLELPPLIEAAQIAFLELFIGPTCSVVFERAHEDFDVMKVPPRDPKAPLLTWPLASGAIFQGLMIFLVVLWLYWSAARGGVPVEEARAEAFFTLMAADFLLCWTLLSRAPFWRRERWTNLSFYAVTASVMGTLALLLWMPFTSSIFHMAWLSPGQILQGLALAGLSVLWFEVPKLKAP